MKLMKIAAGLTVVFRTKRRWCAMYCANWFRRFTVKGNQFDQTQRLRLVAIIPTTGRQLSTTQFSQLWLARAWWIQLLAP